jgi:hypothetical protein
LQFGIHLWASTPHVTYRPGGRLLQFAVAVRLAA